MLNKSIRVCESLQEQCRWMRNFFLAKLQPWSPVTYLPPSFISTTHALSEPSVSVQLYTSIQAVPQVWDRLSTADNLFVQRDYLTALEKSPPQQMRFCYFIFYKQDEAVGLAIGQVLPFQAAESLHDTVLAKASFLPTIKAAVKRFLAKNIQFTALNIGNLLLTGEHGFHFCSSVSRSTQFIWLQEAAALAVDTLNQYDWGINVISLKDFETKNRMPASVNQHFFECQIEPNMVLQIPSDWRTFDDYLEALHSKYRVRVRRAFKKAKAIEKRKLSAQEVYFYRRDMHRLYQKVAQQADFNLLQLHPDYFTRIQEKLTAQFDVVGYFLQDELIGFFTTIKNAEQLEAHFLGFEPSLNRSHQLYLNMLFDIVRTGIQQGVDEIVFARTATTIKSSVGAKAQGLYCYIRHKNPIIHRLLPFLLRLMQPDFDQSIRHPFK